MIKYFCDICGGEIEEGSPSRFYASHEKKSSCDDDIGWSGSLWKIKIWAHEKCLTGKLKAIDEIFKGINDPL